MSDSKVVFSPIIARRLLKKGFSIIDIKPNHENPQASVYVFRNSSLLMDELHNMIDTFKK